MKKVVSCLFLLSCISIFVAKADYPVLTVKDLARVSQDSLNVGSLRSPYEGDTVTVTGIVAVPPCVNAASNDYRPLLAGLNGPYVSILRDMDQTLTEFAGLSLIQLDTNDTATNFRTLKQGDVISINVVVTPINTGGGFGGNNFPARLRTATCFVLSGAAAGLKVTENKPVTFSYPKVETSNFYIQTQFGQQFNVNNGAPYLRMPITLENLTVFRNGGDVLLWDEVSSTFIAMSDLSGYFTVKPHRFSESEYTEPVNGQKINKIKGYILPATVFNQLQLFTIVPIMPEDVEMGAVPPNIRAITRSFDKLFPSSQETVQLDVIIGESETPINPDSVLMYYSVNDQPFRVMTCTNDGFGYLAIIPAQPNGSVVRYYTVVKDMNGVVGRNPLSGTLHYAVKDGTPLIADFVNPIAIPNSQMARNNFGVTFEGIVITDSNDIRFGQVGRYITVQDSRNPFSAIQISAMSPIHPIFEFKRGDKIKFNGKLQGNNNGWTVANPSEHELISSGNVLEPIIVNADSLGNAFVGYTPIEQWRAMLIEVRDVKILDTNAKNGQNTGAFAVASITNPIMQNAFNIETLQSYIRYTTRDTLALQWGREKPIIGDNIAWVRGTLTSNNQTYSIIPRNNDDFGAVTAIDEMENGRAFSSYPNPTADRITFDIPLEEISTVQIINSTGIQVIEKELLTNTLSIETLSNGQYYATVRSGLNTYRFAFTVIR